MTPPNYIEHLLRKENNELPHFLNFCHVLTKGNFTPYTFFLYIKIKISFEQNRVISLLQEGVMTFSALFVFVVLFCFVFCLFCLVIF